MRNTARVAVYVFNYRREISAPNEHLLGRTDMFLKMQ